MLLTVSNVDGCVKCLTESAVRERAGADEGQRVDHPTSEGRPVDSSAPRVELMHLLVRLARFVQRLAAKVSSVRILLKPRRLLCWRPAFQTEGR